MAGSASTILADTTVTTVIDGKTDARELVRITFDGDNAVLHFSDSTTDTADMSLVSVALTHEAQTAVNEIMADPEKPGGVYNLKGQRIADTPEGLEEGIYIVNGQKVLVK